MKNLFMTMAVLLFSNFLSARPASLNDFYNCSYNNGEFNQLLINGFMSPKVITVISPDYQGPIEILVNDYYEYSDSFVKFMGDLPAPWSAGSTFQIELRDTMFTSTLRITGPQHGSGHKAKAVSIPLVCH